MVRGKWKQTGRYYAIKVIGKAEVDRVNKLDDVHMEKHALSHLRDTEGVVKLHATFQDQKNLYLVMDYASEGELWKQCK